MKRFNEADYMPVSSALMLRNFKELNRSINKWDLVSKNCPYYKSCIHAPNVAC
jgi:hypothetical protein